LRALEIIVSDRAQIRTIPSPINLLFYELATTYEQGVSIDDAKNALVFKVSVLHGLVASLSDAVRARVCVCRY
jgi:hypothetical protein